MRDGIIFFMLDGLRGDGEVPVDLALVVAERPVLSALDAAALHRARRHHHHQRALLPHHAPEVAERLREGACNVIYQVLLDTVETKVFRHARFFIFLFK